MGVGLSSNVDYEDLVLIAPTQPKNGRSQTELEAANSYVDRLHDRALKSLETSQKKTFLHLKTSKARLAAWTWVTQAMMIDAKVGEEVWDLLFAEYSRPHRLGKDLDENAFKKILLELCAARKALLQSIMKSTKKKALVSNEKILKEIESKMKSIPKMYGEQNLLNMQRDIGADSRKLISRRDWHENAKLVLFEDILLSSAKQSSIYLFITSTQIVSKRK